MTRKTALKLRRGFAAQEKQNNGLLVDVATGTLVNVGDKRSTFRGEAVVVTGWRAPLHAGSTGRVYVKDDTGTVAEYFPSVIGAKIVRDEAPVCNL